MAFKAIVFDLDGTLVETRDLHFDALNKALETCGFRPISRRDHTNKYNGLPTKRKLEMLGYTPAQIRKISKEKQKVTVELIPSVIKPDPVLIELLDKLSDQFVLGVASNAVRETVDRMLAAAKLDPYLALTLSNEDVSKPKPDPEIYVMACKELCTKPHEVLVVEDNLHGVIAASKAGCRVLQVAGPEQVTLENILGSIGDIEIPEGGEDFS